MQEGHPRMRRAPRPLNPPEAGSDEDIRQQKAIGFSHGPFGRGDPKGHSWSEKYNMWLHRVVPLQGRDDRFRWETWQVGSTWHATLRVLPGVWHAGWETETRYTGGPFTTKRDAKEDVCRLLLEEQRRYGRVPDLTAPTPLAEQVARAPARR